MKGISIMKTFRYIRDNFFIALFAATRQSTHQNMFAILLWVKQYKYLIPFIPSLTGWATVMAATPVAFSLRYVYYLFLLQPVFVYLLVMGLRQDQ